MLKRFQSTVEQLSPLVVRGHVIQCIGLIIEVHCPGLRVGDICEIYLNREYQTTKCQVVGFRENKVLLMSFGPTKGISFGCKVQLANQNSDFAVGAQFLGRVIDAFGKPLDSEIPINSKENVGFPNSYINPLARGQIDTLFPTGIRALDTVVPMGKGQRLGLFAGSGVGKSSLLSAICKNNQQQGVVNVIAMIGERGREVEEFIEESLGAETLKNSVVVVATADQPALVRIRAVYTAIALAEYFSGSKRDVFLTIDSITRFAFALRDVGLSVGEPVTFKGYTSSVFSTIPSIIERCGKFKTRGSITALMTVLVEGDDLNDPVVDTLRAILDGHIVLSRELAERQHYPAIDIMKSLSRLSSKLQTKEQSSKVSALKRKWLLHEENRAILELGMIEGDKSKFENIKNDFQKVCNYLQQPLDEMSTLSEAFTLLNEALDD